MPEPAAQKLLSREAVDELFYKLGCVFPVPYRDGFASQSDDGIVVAALVETIADEQHVIEIHSGVFGEARDAERLVDTRTGDVNRG